MRSDSTGTWSTSPGQREAMSSLSRVVVAQVGPARKGEQVGAGSTGAKLPGPKLKHREPRCPASAPGSNESHSTRATPTPVSSLPQSLTILRLSTLDPQPRSLLQALLSTRTFRHPNTPFELYCCCFNSLPFFPNTLRTPCAGASSPVFLTVVISCYLPRNLSP